MDLVRAKIERVIGTSGQDYAVVISADAKSFLIFVGQPEVVAIYRELQGVGAQRPMSHDVIANVMRAFDIEVRKVVISAIVENVFCATLLMAQNPPSQAGDEAIQSNAVRLDLRASDAMIIALKTKSQLWVSREVLDQVEDVSSIIPDDDAD
ncbi:MAG: bifunctional nuclease family protein [Planctomycetes bacterium]|nr:bifunctional nuclease family protein [Planctomycetota bacterium]